MSTFLSPGTFHYIRPNIAVPSIYRTLQNVAFSSFVKTLNFAIRQQTDTKQTCLKCLLSRRFQTEFVFCLDGALRKSTKCLQNFSPV